MPRTQPSQTSADLRWKSLDRIMQRHDYRPDALIETLHAAQDVFGYLDTDTLKYIATRLQVPPSKVYGVTTFYNHFNTKPRGEHTLVVCTGTACHVKGNDRILTWMQEHFGLLPGETTPDKQFHLQQVRCIGCCGLAPVVTVNEKVLAKVKAADVIDQVYACAVKGA